MITTERLTLEDFTLDDAFEIEQWRYHIFISKSSKSDKL